MIPNEAHAKITCRLVADQDPNNIADLIDAHVARHAPLGVKMTVRRLFGSSDPYRMPRDHSENLITAEVLPELFGTAPYHIRLGGSIAACPLFLKDLGCYTVKFAFQLEDERLHAPYEFFCLTSFERGQKGYCLLLHRLNRLAV